MDRAMALKVSSNVHSRLVENVPDRALVIPVLELGLGPPAASAARSVAEVSETISSFR